MTLSRYSGRVPGTRRQLGKMAALVAAMPGFSALAACGRPSAAPAARQAGPITIEYLGNLPMTHPAGAARLDLLKEFNATNTRQITVALTGAEATTSEEKAKTLAAAGTPPALFYAAYYFGAGFFASGMTIDLDAELKGERDWAKQRGDFYPNMLETSIWTGKLVAMPGYTNNNAIVYNPILLQQAGVPPPKQGWTWDDFTTTAQRFARQTTSSGAPVVPLSMAWISWPTWLGTTGARVITKDARKITADTPEFLSVLEYWLDLQKRGIALITPDGKNGVSETYALAKNDTVFEVQGSFRLPTFRQAKAPEPLTIHVPVHPAKRQVFAANAGHSMIVFKGVSAEKQHAAALVAQWMSGTHAQAQMCLRNFIPVSKGVAESKEVQDYVKTDAAFKGFLDLAPQGWRWPSLPSYDKINKTIQDNVDPILRQEIGVKAGLAKAQRDAQTLLDEDVRLMG